MQSVHLYMASVAFFKFMIDGQLDDINPSIYTDQFPEDFPHHSKVFPWLKFWQIVNSNALNSARKYRDNFVC